MNVLILFFVWFVSLDRGSAVFRYFLALILLLPSFFPRKNNQKSSLSPLFLLRFPRCYDSVRMYPPPLFRRVAVYSLLGVSKLKI